MIENATFQYKTALTKANVMLRQITEWGVKNRSITKNRVLPLTISYVWKFNLSIRNIYK